MDKGQELNTTESAHSDPFYGKRRSSLRRQESVDESVIKVLSQRRSDYDAWSLKHPITTTPHNSEIAYEIRMFTANHPGTVILRYFLYKNPSLENNNLELGVYIFRDAKMDCIPLDWRHVIQAIQQWNETLKLTANPDTRITELQAALCNSSEQLSQCLLKPIWKHIGRIDQIQHLVIIPVEELFRVPFHIAFMPGEQIPLCAVVPLSFSVSAAAFVGRGRHLFRRQRVEHTDDLCALIVQRGENDVSGKELVNLNWDERHFHIAGNKKQLPDFIGSYQYVGSANQAGLEKLVQQKPEFFIYGGHGEYHNSYSILGPALILEEEGSFLTQFDIAMGLRLPRNKLTLLGACVSGQGVNLGGGEVSGFLRAFIAAGCGAIGITLWEVLDDEIANSVRHLLNQAKKSADDPSSVFDVVQELHQYYKNTCSSLESVAKQIEACPFALYL
ncbi:MAG: CHAT domain-containing protein [Oculatellaceae cyanobacterium bins.114]|nr:CHAT domain-containing protein [Oculatellaceae cyanobacterium bins.114]